MFMLARALNAAATAKAEQKEIDLKTIAYEVIKQLRGAGGQVQSEFSSTGVSLNVGNPVYHSQSSRYDLKIENQGILQAMFSSTVDIKVINGEGEARNFTVEKPDNILEGSNLYLFTRATLYTPIATHIMLDLDRLGQQAKRNMGQACQTSLDCR